VLRSTEIALTNDIDPRDLETTLRVLAQIADRARSLRTSGQASH
jgi:AAA+ ATPase superfamily predicted ATPase